MTPPQAKVVVGQIHATFGRWLQVEDYHQIDAVCAAVLANRIPRGLPVWLALVGPPGTGKTVLVESLYALKGVHKLGSVSRNSLASGFPNRKGHPPTGLLERMVDRKDDEGYSVSDGTKFLIVKDMATIFSAERDVKNHLLSQFRDVYDGELHAMWGSAKPELHWKGRVGSFVCSTAFWDQQMAVFQQLGDRFLVWRATKAPGKGAARKAIRQDEQVMMEELQQAMALLDTYVVPRVLPEMDEAMEEWLEYMTTCAAVLRTPIPRDWQHNMMGPMKPEPGIRLYKQMAQVYRGLCLLHGVDVPDKDILERDILPVMFRMIVSPISPVRMDILRLAMNRPIPAQTLARHMKIGRTPTRYACQDMYHLDILVYPEGVGWQTAPEFRRFGEWLGVQDIVDEVDGDAGVDEEDDDEDE